MNTYVDIYHTYIQGNFMKKVNIMVAPIFIVVVSLLAVGAVGELFQSMFAKAKSHTNEHEASYEGEAEVAIQS
jgi:hypothetical protein